MCTKFIGRGKELAAVRQELAAPDRVLRGRMQLVDKADRASAGLAVAGDVRFLTSREGRRYALLAFIDENETLAAVQEYFGDKNDFGIVKKFDVAYRNSKNE
ncbi:hypothetical protein FOZ63_022370, partial [Perkinsus olseni]